MAFQDIPLLGRYATKKGIKDFTPEGINQAYETYRSSLQSNLTLTDPMQTYDAERVDNISKLKDKDDKPLDFSGLNATQKQTLNDALQLTPASKDEIDKFKSEFNSLNAVIKDVDPSAVAHHLTDLITEAKKAIEAQFNEEKTRIEAAFTPPSTVAPPLTDANKDSILTALTKSKDDAIQKVEKALQDKITELHQLGQAERDRIFFLATLSNISYNERRIKEFQDSQAFKDRENQSLQASQDAVEVSIGDGNAKFKNLNIDDFPILETMTGNKMNIGKDPNGNALITMELPRWGLLYFNSWHQNIDYDLTNIAMGVRAAGHSRFTGKVNYASDPEYAMELGRRMYEACLKAGFEQNTGDPKKDPQNITIEVNGKIIPIDELFGPTRQDRLNTLHADAKAAKARRDAMLNTRDAPAMKAALEDFKAQTDAHKLSTQQPGGPTPVI